eukprot:3632990-Lingulodinium_polyedra.AAC.1
MLRANQIKSHRRLKPKLDNVALSCQLTQLDVAAIENALEASAPPGVFGPVAESERGWFGR